MYARYKSHDNAILSYMEDTLHHFQSCKHIFLLGQAGKKAIAKPNVLYKKPVKNGKVDVETTAETWTPWNKGREMEPWWDDISHGIDVPKEFLATSKFPKIDLMSHSVQQIRRYGALHLCSAERHDHAHTLKIKNDWKASCHNLMYLPQTIAFSVAFPALQWDSTNSKRSLCIGRTVLLPAKPALPVLICLPHRATSYVQRPNSCDPKTAIMKGILMQGSNTSKRYLIIRNTQCTTCQHTAARGSLSSIAVATRCIHQIKKRLAMQLCIHHHLVIQAELLEGELISEMSRCTVSFSMCRGDRQNDWVGVMPLPGRCYSTLNGRLPWWLQRLVKIELLNEHGAFIEYWLALVLTTIPENLGNLDPVSKFVQIENILAAISVHIFSVGNLIDYMHVISELTATSKAGIGGKERWIVNSHINLVTWNNVYD